MKRDDEHDPHDGDGYAEGSGPEATLIAPPGYGGASAEDVAQEGAHTQVTRMVQTSGAEPPPMFGGQERQTERVFAQPPHPGQAAPGYGGHGQYPMPPQPQQSQHPHPPLHGNMGVPPPQAFAPPLPRPPNVPSRAAEPLPGWVTPYVIGCMFLILVGAFVLWTQAKTLGHF